VELRESDDWPTLPHLAHAAKRQPRTSPCGAAEKSPTLPAAASYHLRGTASSFSFCFCHFFQQNHPNSSRCQKALPSTPVNTLTGGTIPSRGHGCCVPVSDLLRSSRPASQLAPLPVTYNSPPHKEALARSSRIGGGSTAPRV
jgi:hypothetical protein